MNDAALAADLAHRVGALLLAVRAEGDAHGWSAKETGAEGDRRANALICATLRSERPDDGLLSEEEKDDAARLNKARVWIVDPLDGTREFGERRGDWAVHIGLADDGVATVGAVALPGLSDGLVLRSDQIVARPPAPPRPRLLVSRTRPAPEAVEVANRLDADLIAMGSAGAKAMAVVRGEAEIYLHSGGQYEWDNCAPVAVAAAHGLHCSRLDGSPVRYNRPDPYLPDLLICRPELAQGILGLVAELSR